MGILGMMLAGAAESGGNAVSALTAKSTLLQEQAAIEEARDARLREARNTDTIAAEGRADTRTIATEGRAETRTIATEKRGILNKVEEQTSLAPGRMKELREISEINVEQAKKIAKAAAEVDVANAGNADWVKAQRTITSAKESSATRASAAASMQETALRTLQVDQARKLKDARDGYVKAVASKDPAAIEQARATQDALERTLTSDTARAASAASVFRTLALEADNLDIKASAIKPADISGEYTAEQKAEIKNLKKQAAENRSMSLGYLHEYN
ncbi:MAG: hypothetical protein Q8R92_16965, partial [Deltaproteobacteria bacterium]|nr:hypothetical protein [Deltaproteobacteria bacterium]